MGMIFKSDAVNFIITRLNAEFGHSPAAPAQGFGYWAGGSGTAPAFRADLAASKTGGRTIGQITLQYFRQFDIPNSNNGDVPPSGPDPSGGQSRARWIVFWQNLKRNHPSVYNAVVDLVLNNLIPINNSLMFDATQGAVADVHLTNRLGGNYSITLTTPFWYGV